VGGARPDGYARGRATKAAIVAKATEVFAESGFEGASQREIARRCGIAHATLLHHFPTKADLLTAVLGQRDSDQTPALTDRRWGLEELFGYFILLARQNATRSGLTRLHLLLEAEAANPNHPARDYFVGRNAMWVKAVTTVVARETREHPLAVDLDAESVALMTIALWDGLQLVEPLAAEHVDVAAVLSKWFELLLGHPLPAKGSDLEVLSSAEDPPKEVPPR